MTESYVEQTRLAYRQGNPKEALYLSEQALAESCSESSLAVLESAGQTGKIDAEAQARMAMHKGYLMGSLARYA